MTAQQYRRMEELMAKVEDITMEHPMLTPQGHSIKVTVRDLVVKVTAERIRTEDREARRKPN